MKKKTKWTLAVVLLLIVGVVVAGYGYFYGFTKKSRYNKCVETCEEMVFQESSKAACGPRCSQVTGYMPSKDETKKSQKNTKKSSKADSEKKEDNVNPDKEEAKKYIDNSTPWEEREYYCKWVWPQEIIDKNTGEPIYACSSERPWCVYGKDKKYGDSGCCKKYDKETKEKKDCVYLPELLKKAGIR